MAYADKCFFFDWGDREIRLEDFDNYGSISLRRRWLYDNDDRCVTHLSIELWGKQKENSDERYEDQEIVLSKDNAMKLAGKIIRAVAELDSDEYLSDLKQDVALLKEINRKKFDEAEDRWREFHLYKESKGGIAGALKNYVDTPRGKDTIKKMGEKNGD